MYLNSYLLKYNSNTQQSSITVLTLERHLIR